MAKLTARRVETEKRPGSWGDGAGLYLQVAAGGSKSWIYRFQIDGRRRSLGLGGTGTVSLAEAREKAAEARKLVAAGQDPIEARNNKAAPRVKAMTFAECADAYIAAHRASWRHPRHASQWPASLEAYAYPIFGHLPVAVVDVGLVMRAIEPIWSTKPETASRVRSRIEAVLDWARARGHRSGENPARWRGMVGDLLPARRKMARVEHMPALPYAELGAFMTELRAVDGIPARALEFAILTAARTGEVLGARWDEINLVERLWTVPAARMKAGKEHRVPLSDAALAIVEQMAAIRHSDYLFPGHEAGRPRGAMSMSRVLEIMGHGNVTVHGFRSCFRDWSSEATSFASEVAEMALAHAVPSPVERAYRRGDMLEKRRAIMDAWAAYCAAPAMGEVVPIRA